VNSDRRDAPIRGTSENIAFRLKSYTTERGFHDKSVCFLVRFPIDKGLSKLLRSHVQIIGKHLIEAAQKKHANWKGSLGSWVRIVEGVDPPWSNFPAVRRTRKDADPVGDCVVFDIKNNEARLISYISYEMGTVTVLAVLTHKEYDKGGWKIACNC